MRHASDRLVDVNQRPDINEIIAGADAFLTDYSSTIFEGAMIELPGFIYADELEEYVADRRDLFFDMYQLPFQVALNNDELMSSISVFDEEIYKKKLAAFMDEMGILYFYGKNCLTDRILERYHLKSFATPYSWVRSNIEYINEIEEDNFAYLLSADYLECKNIGGKLLSPVIM